MHMIGHEAGKRQATPRTYAVSSNHTSMPTSQPVLAALKEPVTRVFARNKRTRQGDLPQASFRGIYGTT
jgi:hypothetical protein